jgi:DNA modification methylase
MAKIADSTTVAIDSLQLWNRNPRSIKGDRFNELKERLKRQGQIKPLLVAKDGVTVIGGNMRLRAMKDLGIEEVWVSQTEAQTDKEIFDLALTDNEEFGYYEQEQVAELALELGLSPLELKSYALSLGEPTTLDLVIDKFGPEDVEEDEVPEVDETEPPASQLGEVYQLGRHRLMCGDSTDGIALAELIHDASIDLVHTDPPYGIDANNMTMGKGKKEFHRGSTNWDTEAVDVAYLLELAPKVCIWGGNYFADQLPANNDWLCWHKKNDDRSFSEFELAWTNYGKNTRILSHHWGGEEKQHVTMKPLAVCMWAIKLLPDIETVLDVYGGSGSTLIACEQTNRTCYMMELDPKYCDVTRKRYAKHIGEEEAWQELTPAINSLVVV